MKDITSTLFDKKPRMFIFEKINELAFFGLGLLAYHIEASSISVTALLAIYLIVETSIRSLELNKKHREKSKERLEEMELK